MKVYKIVNNITGMSYVGQTTRSVEERWVEHCKPALKGRSYLSNAVQKYGKNSFSIEELGTVKTQDEADLLEKTMIEKHQTLFPNGYNLREGGLGGSHSQEVKDKLSKLNKGKKKSWQSIKKVSDALRGKPGLNRRPVIGTNLITGETLRLEWPGAMPEKFHYNCVHRCAKGERKKHKGYRWEYAD